MTNNYDSTAELLILKEYFKHESIILGTGTKTTDMIKIGQLITMVNNVTKSISSWRTLNHGSKMNKGEEMMVEKLKKHDLIPLNAPISRETYNTYIVESDENKKFLIDSKIDFAKVDFAKVDFAKAGFNKDGIDKTNVKDDTFKLMYKLFKRNGIPNLSHNEFIQHVTDIITTSDYTTIDTLMHIIESISKYKIDLTNKSSNSKQYFIDNLYTLIKRNIIDDDDIHIMDIGGGECKILIGLQNKFNLPNKNIVCVEQKGDWYEKYTYVNDINYIFWDNKTIDMSDNSMDVITILVVLHHMDDKIIRNVVKNAYRLLKKGGIVIIKEHDCSSKKIKKLIDYEHYIYHIIELYNRNTNITQQSLEEFLSCYVSNYKSKDEFDKIFTDNGFDIVEELDVSFQKLSNVNNSPSKLYWKVYKSMKKK
jgi:ubiquinone/menaquinone biosynthesis C-methylase UbiE